MNRGSDTGGTVARLSFASGEQQYRKLRLINRETFSSAMEYLAVAHRINNGGE